MIGIEIHNMYGIRVRHVMHEVHPFEWETCLSPDVIDYTLGYTKPNYPVPSTLGEVVLDTAYDCGCIVVSSADERDEPAATWWDSHLGFDWDQI